MARHINEPRTKYMITYSLGFLLYSDAIEGTAREKMILFGTTGNIQIFPGENSDKHLVYPATLYVFVESVEITSESKKVNHGFQKFERKGWPWRNNSLRSTTRIICAM